MRQNMLVLLWKKRKFTCIGIMTVTVAKSMSLQLALGGIPRRTKKPLSIISKISVLEFNNSLNIN